MAKRIVNEEELKLEILTRLKRRSARRAPRTKRDLQLCAELIDLGYLDGWVTIGSDHQPVRIADLKITRDGEEFLEQHQPFSTSTRRSLNKQTRVILKGLAFYFLLISFFLLLRASGAISSEPTIAKTTSSNSSSRAAGVKWPVGVCGIPPVQ